LSRFWSTLDFDRKYIRNESKYRIANIFVTDQAIDKRKTALYTTIPSTFDKNGEFWSTNKRVYAVNVYPPKMNTARAAYRLMQLHSQVAFIGATFQPLNCLPSRTYGPGRPHVGLCPMFLVCSIVLLRPVAHLSTDGSAHTHTVRRKSVEKGRSN